MRHIGGLVRRNYIIPATHSCLLPKILHHPSFLALAQNSPKSEPEAFPLPASTRHVTHLTLETSKQTCDCMPSMHISSWATELHSRKHNLSEKKKRLTLMSFFKKQKHLRTQLRNPLIPSQSSTQVCEKLRLVQWHSTGNFVLMITFLRMIVSMALCSSITQEHW